MRRASIVLLTLAALLPRERANADPVRFEGRIVDAKTGAALSARVSIQGERGAWHFVRSANAAGAAVVYRKERGESVEAHTTVSADPFVVELEPGHYTIDIERGKEYFALRDTFTLESAPLKKTFRLERWIDMAALGWFSGETHVHRSLEELPPLMLAEDLNVAFPLTSWVTEAFTPPSQGQRSPAPGGPARLMQVDPTHVIWTANTEWEIFTVNKQPHTLGAIFAIGQKEPIELGAPPVREIAARARRAGALLELDKHNWPWSMMLVPVMQVDLFELANNHVWRTRFGFPQFGEAAADYMNVERDARGFTERGWLMFGFQNYYALLNCGFNIMPTAGTASGVHPVPLGFGRVYVHLPQGFSYAAWLEGLARGRSFVTTGPMLQATLEGRDPGHRFPQQGGRQTYTLAGAAAGARRVDRIEVLRDGEVIETIPGPKPEGFAPGQEHSFEVPIEIEESAWIAVRCFEPVEDGRLRFAHTAPFFVDVPGRPLRPRKVEVEYLLRRVEAQRARSRDVLPAEALEEYDQAAGVYRKLLARAR